MQNGMVFVACIDAANKIMNTELAKTFSQEKIKHVPVDENTFSQLIGVITIYTFLHG